MSRKMKMRVLVLTTGRNTRGKYLKGATRMYNNELWRSVRPTLGYTFQNDFLAMAGRFHYRNGYTDISQREQLAAAVKDGHSG